MTYFLVKFEIFIADSHNLIAINKATKKKKNQKALANELQKLQEADTETTDALPHTQKHDAHINLVCKSFAITLSAMGHKWANLLKEKEFQLPNGKKVMVPTIFVDISGERTLQSCR